MSGLKINYQKSEVFALGCSEEEMTRVAQMFNCNIGHLPMKYSGVMVHNKHMSLKRPGFPRTDPRILAPRW
jgi:hypothetical protein